jgi:SSS family solute:Na+ symporter
VAGIFGALARFLILQLPIFLLVIYSVITPQLGAYPASLLTLGLFMWYYKKENHDLPFYQSDIFYAGILTGTMVWIMYYFA